MATGRQPASTIPNIVCAVTLYVHSCTCGVPGVDQGEERFHYELLEAWEGMDDDVSAGGECEQAWEVDRKSVV